VNHKEEEQSESNRKGSDWILVAIDGLKERAGSCHMAISVSGPVKGRKKLGGITTEIAISCQRIEQPKIKFGIRLYLVTSDRNLII